MIKEKYIGFAGILIILLFAFILSTNKKKINYRLVLLSLLMQWLTGIFILKTKVGQSLFSVLAKGVTKILEISQTGSEFVFGPLANQDLISKVFGTNNSFIFVIQLVPTIIFICSLVSALYYFGIIQIVIKFFAVIFNKILGVSGAEALANSIVAIVGQVESAIVIQPYLNKLTKSEILTIMTGGMACISGSLMAIYASFGIKPEFLLAASFMAIPGSFLVSKIMCPEDSMPVTKNSANIAVNIKERSLVEAILDGAYSGAKISIGVIAMLIAFIGLLAMIDKLLYLFNASLSIKKILGFIFTPFVYLLGVAKNDVALTAQLLGTKISLNEFIAYVDLSKIINNHQLNQKSIIINIFMLCGFANFTSIAIQVGGLSQMAPERKSDFAEAGFKAMVCGALVSCISAAIAGILVT